MKGENQHKCGQNHPTTVSCPIVCLGTNLYPQPRACSFPPLSFLPTVEVFCGTEELLFHSKISGKYKEKIITSEQVTSAIVYLQRDISDLLTQLRISFQPGTASLKK